MIKALTFADHSSSPPHAWVKKSQELSSTCALLHSNIASSCSEPLDSTAAKRGLRLVPAFSKSGFIRNKPNSSMLARCRPNGPAAPSCPCFAFQPLHACHTGDALCILYCVPHPLEFASTFGREACGTSRPGSGLLPLPTPPPPRPCGTCPNRLRVMPWGFQVVRSSHKHQPQKSRPPWDPPPKTHETSLAPSFMIPSLHPFFAEAAHASIYNYQNTPIETLNSLSWMWPWARLSSAI